MRRLLAILGIVSTVLAACTTTGRQSDTAPGGSAQTINSSTSDLPCSKADCLTETALRISQSGDLVAALRYVESSTVGLFEGQNICHDVLHRVGVREAERPQDNFSTTTLSACSGGLLHGLFAGYGLRTSWAADMVAVCAPFSGIDALLCKHGYGHGAVAGADSVGAAMARCKEVVTLDGGATVEGVSLLELCSDGGFMEVVVKIYSGEWVRQMPEVLCGGLEDWAAWGCWRQIGRILDTELLPSFADSCNGLKPYLAEACAIGVAESVVGNRLDPVIFCKVLLVGADLCATRAKARLG